ncbi:MAG: VCBS repeat-containing protein [Planctomycetes bacterium]|nr:VCBS repeat-containing protein [Planctomycetota bacterium]
MNCPRLRPVTSIVAGLLAASCAKHSGTDATLTPSPGVPRFETRIEINSGTGTHSDFHVADLNSDGILDMAVIGVSGELKIMLGDGTTFTDGQAVSVGGTPVWIHGGDLDADGDIDLAIVQASIDKTAVYLNDGAGTFTAGATLPVGADTLAVRVGDVDGDNHLDIVVSRMVSPQVMMFRGNGLGGFTGAVPIALPGGGAPINIAIGDATRDGVSDLVVTDAENSRLLIYPGNGTTTIAAPFELAIAGSPRAVSLGDLNSDGNPDLAVSAFDAGKVVVVTDFDMTPGSGPTTFTATEIQLESSPGVTAIGDVTGDGLADLVSCQLGVASLLVIPQLPGGVLGDYEQLDGTGLPLRPFIGDIDKDGNNDLVALSGLGDRINLWLAQPGGRLAGARSYASSISVASFLSGGDFDGDGDEEFIVGSFNSTDVCVMERRADGGLRPALTFNVGASVLQVEATDLDFDGRADVLVSVQGGVKVLRSRSVAGGYDFEVLPGLLTTVAPAVAPFGIATADLNRDGSFDIAVCDYGGNAVHVVSGTPDPFVFGADTVIPVLGRPVDVVAADFTGDEHLDLAVSRAELSDIAIFENDGAGGFHLFLSVPVGLAPNYLITGDFNRDLRADIVVSNASSGTVTVLFGGSNGFFGQSYEAGSSPTALLAGDLTGDGRDDVLVTSLQSGDFRVLVGDGNGSFPDVVRFPGTLGASSALLQDIDGDGLRDLLIASLITNRVSLVRNIRQ